VFAHPLTKLALYGFSFAFFFHLMNGVRHLTWDTGHGLERKAARTSGWIAFLGALVLTVLFWILTMRVGGGAA
jgi:succinate dehydrogenase / fumarate reductase cytochrome b subunit